MLILAAVLFALALAVWASFLGRHRMDLFFIALFLTIEGAAALMSR